MKDKFIIFCFCLLFPLLVLSQENDRGMNLLSSSHSRTLSMSTGHTMIYKPVFEHKGSRLSADSGFLYTDDLRREYFDAFGNVVITQPSGTIIYADKLNYDADRQTAVLTNRIRMIDGNSILTTNYLTYNMRSEIGQYTGGGRIVNQQDTITSQKAWYFNKTQDAYFREKVVVRNPDITILTDTMRYNTTLKTSYFYGATNIQGKNGENLYTEEGYYESESEFAKFTRNNLYTEKSKFLKGDTLDYRGDTGNALAIGNVVYIDTLDQVFLTGGRGLYRKVDESITMTDEPLVTMLTKSNDSIGGEEAKRDSIHLTADVLFSKVIPAKEYVPRIFNTDRQGGPLDLDDEDFTEPEEAEPVLNTNITGDSLAMTIQIADSLTSSLIDTTAQIRSKPSVPKKMEHPKDSTDQAKIFQQIEVDLKADSVLRNQITLPTENVPDSLLRSATEALNKAPDSTKTALDSTTNSQNDTAQVRIIQAFKNVRLFKSDLQAVADSAFYGYPDSMLRMYGNPMFWSQNTQFSSDSVFLQIKNEQLDNIVFMSNAFIVQQAKLDTTKYQQLKGRQIRGFFTNDKLDVVYVDGNAENLAYIENEEKTGFSDVFHNRSTRIKFVFENEELTRIVTHKNSDGTIYPLSSINRDLEILDGFIWKPSDRPRSKEDLLKRKRMDVAIVEEELSSPTTEVENPPSSSQP